MIACPSCATELPEASRFCLSCGARLAAPAAAAEERKIVTTLFCDLVGFTAMSEAADPEDVDRLLGEYFARATKVIESHGGTVEKFIGDAVVGVFGVPAVHEDDPERAVRAGLRIVQALEGIMRPDGSPLEVRAGVNTGEALVRLDVDPLSGRGFLTGDSANVAARLQAAAPPMGVAVGALTHELSQRAFVFEELPAVAAKGKSEPVEAWRALAPVSRLGADATVALTPLVGRDTELVYLTAMLDRSLADSTPQLVLIVGEPGIGKSRLVLELLARVDARPDLVTWRQGRCPPYGEAATFWALGEIVKAHAGVLETDSEQVAEAKLEAILPEGSDRDWFRQRLRPLLGLEAPPVDPGVNHTAWLRFFEGLAATRPTVLVFEDLHWADEPLLAFLEYLASHVDAVPLLVVGTARPQLFEEHPGFLAAARHTQRVGLEPLSMDDTGRLVEGLMEGAGARSSAVAEIVHRAVGNPFYAEESVRLLMDRADASTLPASVQAVIAARLDALHPEQKALLGDAAVIGETFWAGAVDALGGHERGDVDDALYRLVEKQLVRRVRTSSMAGEEEFAFVHGLARDVSYQTLPRTVRAARHVAAATWIEGVAGDRFEDLAGVLAHHYTTAHDLFGASGDAEQAVAAARHAVRYLTLAGERAYALDAESAERHYARALELADEGDTQRPVLLLKWAQVLNVLCTQDDCGIAALIEAIPALLAQGDVRRGALGMTELNFFLDRRCEWDPQLSIEALELLRGDDPSPEFITVASRAAMCRWWLNREQRHQLLPELQAILELSVELGLPTPVDTLKTLGALRCSLGDAGGLADSGAAVDEAREQGLGQEYAHALVDHAILVASIEGPRASLRICDEALHFCERRGMRVAAAGVRGLAAEALGLDGAWDKALAAVTSASATLDDAGDTVDLIQVRSQEAMLRCWSGDLEAALALAAWLEERGATVKSIGLDVYCHAPAALARYLAGDRERALALLADIEVTHGFNPDARYAELLTDGMRVAIACGAPQMASRLVQGIDSIVPLYEHILATADALLDQARGAHASAATGFVDAATGWHDFGVPYEEGHALLGQGRSLLALDRASDAAAPLAAAGEIFARLGAKPALEATEAVLAAAAAAAEAGQ